MLMVTGFLKSMQSKEGILSEKVLVSGGVSVTVLTIATQHKSPLHPNKGNVRLNSHLS